MTLRKESYILQKVNGVENPNPKHKKDGLFMSKIPIEYLVDVGNSKYEIVKAAVLEAKRLNHLRFIRQSEIIPIPNIPNLEEKDLPEEKVTILALKRLMDGKVRILVGKESQNEKIDNPNHLP